MFLFPFYYMIIGSLQKTANTSLSGIVPQPGNISLHNYGQINAALSLGRAMINSGIFTGGVLLGTLVLGILAGYALAQLRFRGRGLLFGFMLLVLMVPFQLLIIPLYVIIVRNYGLGNSYLGMIAPFAINSTAVFVFRQYFLQVPKELFDAARIDGANELRVLTRIALPLVRPAVLTAMLLTFIGPWNEFLWPFLITKQQSLQPLAVALANYISIVVRGRDESVRRDHGRIVRAGSARGRIVHNFPAALRDRQYRLRRERLTVPTAPTVATNVPYRLTRLGVLMSAEPGAEFEAEGVLNPASGRSPDGRLWLLPRLVAAGKRVQGRHRGDPGVRVRAGRSATGRRRPRPRCGLGEIP